MPNVGNSIMKSYRPKDIQKKMMQAPKVKAYKAPKAKIKMKSHKLKP